jgi:hypothetical protein
VVSDKHKGKLMKNARELMLAYLAGTAEETGALFAPTGTLELPYLASIGLPPVLTGPTEITKFLGFLHGTLYPGFAFANVKILIDTPEQVFAEYQINHKSGISGKSVTNSFSGTSRSSPEGFGACARPSTSLWPPRRFFPTA